MITSNFNTELQLLEVSYSGNITMKDLVEFGNQIYGNKKLPRSYAYLPMFPLPIIKLVPMNNRIDESYKTTSISL